MLLCVHLFYFISVKFNRNLRKKKSLQYNIVLKGFLHAISECFECKVFLDYFTDAKVILKSRVKLSATIPSPRLSKNLVEPKRIS